MATNHQRALRQLPSHQATAMPQPILISDGFALLVGLSLGFALVRHHSRMMAAESCTGGLISHWVTAIGGSSQWFDGAVVSYANAAKQSLLGVSADTLQRDGAVSEQTARDMASGLYGRHRALLANGANGLPSDRLYAVSVTGIAGPQGGRPDKPVGTVWFGWTGPSGTQAQQRQFSGDRGQIQRQAAFWALAGVFSRLFQRPDA